MKATLLALAVLLAPAVALAYDVEVLSDLTPAVGANAVMHTSGATTDASNFPFTSIADVSGGFHYYDGSTYDVAVSCVAHSDLLARSIKRGALIVLSSGSLVIVDKSSSKGHDNALGNIDATVTVSGRTIGVTVTGLSGKEIDWACYATANIILIRQWVP